MDVVLWLLPMIVVAVLVARWAWRFQLRVQHLAARRLIDLVGTPGTLTNVTLNGVLIQDDAALVAFCPAGTGRQGRDHLPVGATTLVVSLKGQDPSAAGRLQRWHASSARLLLWRDRDGQGVELTQVQTGQQVRLPVAATPPARVAGAGRQSGSGPGLAA